MAQEQETEVTAAKQAAALYSGRSRAFVQINKGEICFGDRNLTTGARTTRFKISPASLTENGTTYYGVSCTATKIDLRAGENALRLKVGGNVHFTGYLRTVTKVTVTWAGGVRWQWERIPFICGVCVAKR